MSAARRSVDLDFINDRLAQNRRLFGNAVMTVDPALAAPPVVPGVTFDPATGDPVAAPPATDPAGVWAAGVVPPAVPQVVPPPTVAPVAPVAVPGEQPYVEIGGVKYFNESFIEQARAQERDKMHNRVESIESELRAQREAREAEIAEAQRLAAEQAAEEERARIAALPTEEKITELQNSWEERWRRRDEQDAMRDAIAAQEKRLQDAETYRQRRLGEEQDLIHPSLRDLVTGFTEEEIERSISDLKSRTDAIVGTLRQEQVAYRQALPGVAPTGAPPSATPMDITSGYQQVTPAEIAAMDPATFAKNRDALMAAMRNHIASNGLYG